MIDFNLSDLFHRSTRIIESSCSYLDVFLSTSLFFWECVSCLLWFLVIIILFSEILIVTSLTTTLVIKVYRLDALVNWILYCYKICYAVWHDVLSFDDNDDSVLCFTTVLEDSLDFLVPINMV